MKKTLIKVFLLLLVVLIILIGIVWWRGRGIVDDFPEDDPMTNPLTEGADVEVVAENLSIPWDIAFLPDDEGMLVTERDGTLLFFDGSGNKNEIKVGDVKHAGEGGLLGMTLHPDFASNQFIYLYISTPEANGTTNRVVRFQFEGGELTNEVDIMDSIPGALYHDGGRMEFGPDGMLYITTGDATKENLAQDKMSLAGKILRVTEGGGSPEDNPFLNNSVWKWEAQAGLIYSYGHRNPQGLAWDDDGNLWSVEHGRSGIQSGLDELNLIEKGKNYGWPTIEGDETQTGMESPVVHSGADDTWAPASLLYYEGSLFWGGLRGEALYEAVLDLSAQAGGTTVVEVKEHFKGEFGRIRTVRLGPDGMFYLTTSNTDGRGDVRPGDDKIIRVNPEFLKDN